MALVARKSVASAATARRSTVGPRVAGRPVFRVAQQPRFVARAEESTSSETSFDSEKALKDLQAKWDKVENKPTVAAYAAGAVVALWLSGTLVGAINKVPLVPKLMELIGLGYSAWFTYRYLLFKSSREELIKDIDELKKKITGDN